jgi:hypothetical protein
MLRFEAIVIINVFLTLFLTGPRLTAEQSVPFYPNEKLTFTVMWAFIHAGDAVLEICPIETIKGVPSYHFIMTAKSSKFVDLFYKVRDRIDSYTDIHMTHSLLYTKRQQGKSKRDIVVSMNWEKGVAQYSNFGKKAAPISILPGAFDPLSIFYAFRTHKLADNTIIKTPVTDGKKCVIGNARVIKRETIRVPTGSYDTYLVEPEMEHIGGVFKKSKNAKLSIWVTADNKCMPVRIESEVAVGSFVAELISCEMGSPLKRGN